MGFQVQIYFFVSFLLIINKLVHMKREHFKIDFKLNHFSFDQTFLSNFRYRFKLISFVILVTSVFVCVRVCDLATGAVIFKTVAAPPSNCVTIGSVTRVCSASAPVDSPDKLSPAILTQMRTLMSNQNC